MSDVGIVAATRTPIGRAFKGSLVTKRPDDLAGEVIRAALLEVPGLPPDEVEDVTTRWSTMWDSSKISSGNSALRIAYGS